MKPTPRDIASLYDSAFARAHIQLRHILFPFDAIEAYIPKKGTFYDIGCGFGAYFIYFALTSKQRKIIGLDLNKKRIELAQKASKGIPNIKFEQRDLRRSTKMGTADGVVLIDLLHHIPYETQVDLLESCKSHLKKGGVVIIKDIAKKPRWKFAYNFIHDKIMTRNDPLFFRDPKGYRDILIKNGFEVVKGPELLKIWPGNPIPHFILIMKKK